MVNPRHTTIAPKKPWAKLALKTVPLLGAAVLLVLAGVVVELSGGDDVACAVLVVCGAVLFCVVVAAVAELFVVLVSRVVGAVLVSVKMPVGMVVVVDREPAMAALSVERCAASAEESDAKEAEAAELRLVTAVDAELMS